MTLVPGIHEATRRVVAILDGVGAPYAIGGAVGMAFAGHLRGTRDVDILALVPAVRFQELADALQGAGFRMKAAGGAPSAVDARALAESSRADGLVRLWWEDVRVDLFTPRVPLQDSILQRRRRVELESLSVWIATAEDLILLKMIFHRPKDIEDVRHLLAANAGELDGAYLERWIPRTLAAPVGDELRALMRGAGAG